MVGLRISAIANASIAYKENCNALFYSNYAIIEGGAITLFNNFIIRHQLGYSVIMFFSNGAGATSCEVNSYFTFDGDSKASFSNNTAELGGAVYLYQFLLCQQCHAWPEHYI